MEITDILTEEEEKVYLIFVNDYLKFLEEKDMLNSFRNTVIYLTVKSSKLEERIRKLENKIKELEEK
jgi:hypothetical protein